MRRYPSVTFLGLALLLRALPSVGVDGISITGQRITLRDVLPECPGRACSADLGPAPPPGSSRLIAPAAMQRAIEGAGEDATAFLALTPVRVVSAARSLSPNELGALVRPAIEGALPEGVRIVSVEAKSALVVPLTVSVGECTLPPLPRRPGPVTTTALVTLLHEGVVVRREPVLVRLVQSERAARPAVPRGHTLTLVIERRSASISAHGVALKDTEIGETAPFKVQRTGRVVRARVISAAVAMVLEQP